MVSETIIWDIIGLARTDMAAFTLSVQIVSKLVFVYDQNIRNIYFIRDVYSVVAQLENKKTMMIARAVASTSHLIWDHMTPHQMEMYFGRILYIEPTPREMIIYFAYYLSGKPFYRLLWTLLLMWIYIAKSL